MNEQKRGCLLVLGRGFLIICFLCWIVYYVSYQTIKTERSIESFYCGVSRSIWKSDVDDFHLLNILYRDKYFSDEKDMEFLSRPSLKASDFFGWKSFFLGRDVKDNFEKVLSVYYEILEVKSDLQKLDISNVSIQVLMNVNNAGNYFHLLNKNNDTSDYLALTKRMIRLYESIGGSCKYDLDGRDGLRWFNELYAAEERYLGVRSDLYKLFTDAVRKFSERNLQEYLLLREELLEKLNKEMRLYKETTERIWEEKKKWDEMSLIDRWNAQIEKQKESLNEYMTNVFSGGEGE